MGRPPASQSRLALGSAPAPEHQLEAEDVEVQRQMQIGAREAYLPALENGEIDLIPEYTEFYESL